MVILEQIVEVRNKNVMPCEDTDGLFQIWYEEMIRSQKDLRHYLARDKKASGFSSKKAPAILGDDIWKFLISLRHIEYALNKKPSSVLTKFQYAFWKYRNYKLSCKLGFSIPPNTLGPGVKLAHRGTIVINSAARIGADCTIHVCVNIGATGGSIKAPVVGNGVYIGPGVKMFGDIVIADKVTIGANAVVNKSIDQIGATAVGIPAKIVSESPLR